jgi:DNA-directed RNA polymerase delta subunit
MNQNYQKICSELLKNLPQRTANVIERRFGLRTPQGAGETGERETLEAIGKSYGITRERVRQIENEGFSQIKPKTKNYPKIFQYFNEVLESFGELKKEETLLSSLGEGKYQNQVSFLLTLGEDFQRFSEDKDFYSFWTRKKQSVELAKKVIDLTLNKFNKNRAPLTLDELFRAQKAGLSKILGKGLNKNAFYSCLEISKKIEENPEGQVGLKEWVEINPRGIKDRAYLVLRKEGKPLHFTKVAVLIESLPYSYSKKTHTATVHNELIKDPRFVLVGRGLYALQEWGYTPGVVKDIILETLKKAKKPLLKEEILKKVLEQRMVKENTVFLNLQDKSYFSKNSQGKYTLNEDVKEA